MQARISIESEDKHFVRVISELLDGAFIVVKQGEVADIRVKDVNSDVGTTEGRGVFVISPDAGYTRHGLIMRLRAILAKPEAEELALNAAFSLDTARKCLVSADAGSVMLTDLEVALIQKLKSAGPLGLPREELLFDVFGYGADIDTHTLETHVHRLRAKARELVEDAPFLMTTEGGYALAG